MNKQLLRTVRTQVLIEYEEACDGNDMNQEGKLEGLLYVLKDSNYSTYVTGINSKGNSCQGFLLCNMLWKANICLKEATMEFRDAAKFCGIRLNHRFAAEIMVWSKKGTRVVRSVDSHVH